MKQDFAKETKVAQASQQVQLSECERRWGQDPVTLFQSDLWNDECFKVEHDGTLVVRV